MTSDERDVARIRRFCAERELETVFQPLFDLESNECIAFEALTRFPRGPDRGTAEWFASATELGVAAELELAAVETALSYLDQFPPDTTLASFSCPSAEWLPTGPTGCIYEPFGFSFFSLF